MNPEPSLLSSEDQSVELVGGACQDRLGRIPFLPLRGRLQLDFCEMEM